MGCKCSKLSSYRMIIDVSNTTKSSKSSKSSAAELIGSAYEELCRLLPELKSSTFDKSVPVLIKKSVLNDQTLLLLINEEISNAIATIKLLASLKTVVLSRPECNNESTTTSTLHTDVLLIEELASLCLRQKAVCRQLRSKKEEIRGKTRWTKLRRKLCKVMCNVIFVSVLVVSVALSAIAAPHFAVPAAVTCGSLIKAAEQWSDSVWDGVLGKLEEEKEVVKVLMTGEVAWVHELESLRAMAKRLEIVVEGIVIGRAEYVVEPEGMEMVMEKTKLIKEMEEKTETCDREISQVITRLMEVIIEDLQLT